MREDTWLHILSQMSGYAILGKLRTSSLFCCRFYTSKLTLLLSSDIDEHDALAESQVKN